MDEAVQPDPPQEVFLDGSNRSKKVGNKARWRRENPVKSRSLTYRWREKNPSRYRSYMRIYMAERRKRMRKELAQSRSAAY